MTTLRVDGTLVAPSGYTCSRGGGSRDDGAWIVFDRVDGLTVWGGTVDGRGEALWPVGVQAGCWARRLPQRSNSELLELP